MKIPKIAMSVIIASNLYTQCYAEKILETATPGPANYIGSGTLISPYQWLASRGECHGRTGDP
jgi:hypothetical protein